MNEYDIEKAFKAIEDELMASMIRNMKRHRLEEIDEKKEWSMWQTEQLKALEKYKKENQKKFKKQFSDINKSIDSIISSARAQGNMDQEIKILEAIKKGAFSGRPLKAGTRLMGEFFKLNDRKLNALIKAATDDFKRAEQAILRMADDQYRQVIFNAQVYANTGAGTYEQAVDMATKDYLSRGINCIEYANGSRHTLADYAYMAIQTASKRAYLAGEGEKRQEWGISTVIMNKRGNACPRCLPFVGKVLIDDVWSGGKQSDGPYMLMSRAMEKGLYHPRCRDSHTTYFEGITTPGASYTREELKEIEENYRTEQKRMYAKRQEEKFGRLADYSLDKENEDKYRRKENEWKNIEKSLNSDILDISNTKEVTEVHSVGKIDKEIYKCITDNITTEEVIITDERIMHIQERHPHDYERFCSYISKIIEEPDYIIEANKENTGVLLKEIQDNGEKFKLVLRIAVKEDPEFYKNSVISFWHIGDTTWKKALKNKNILYKRE